MVITKVPIRCKLAVNDKPIRQCKQCVYLGVEITSSKNLQQEVRTQVNNNLKNFWLYRPHMEEYCTCICSENSSRYNENKEHDEDRGDEDVDGY
ncbi:hypothetical protein Trydic_g12054 [Trypoxylus dichotomus]